MSGVATKEDMEALVSALRSLESTLRQTTSVIGRGVSAGGGPGAAPSTAGTTSGKFARRETGLASLTSVPEDPPSDVVKRSVTVRVVFLKIGEIDTIHEKYSADVFYQGKWLEPRLNSQTDMDADEIDWSQYWNPYLSIENVLGDNVKDELWHTLTFDEEGNATVTEKHRCKGSFLEYLELNQFPFDTQDLTITVTTGLGEMEVELIEDTEEVSSINVQSFVDEQEWHLHTHIETWRKLTTKVYQNAKFKHPSLSAACKASRRPGFFIWNVLFVMLFICSLAFSTFAVKLDLPQNRLQLSFILLLTCVTFKFVVNQSLPKISYLTYLDKYILTSMSILCLVCIWHAVVAQLVDEIDTAELADRIALAILALIFICFQLFFIIRVVFVAKQKTTIFIKKDKEHEEKLQDKTKEDKQNKTKEDKQDKKSTYSENKIQPV